jgi:hypothetical protein
VSVPPPGCSLGVERQPDHLANHPKGLGAGEVGGPCQAPRRWLRCQEGRKRSLLQASPKPSGPAQETCWCTALHPPQGGPGQVWTGKPVTQTRQISRQAVTSRGGHPEKRGSGEAQPAAWRSGAPPTYDRKPPPGFAPGAHGNLSGYRP